MRHLQLRCSYVVPFIIDALLSGVNARFPQDRGKFAGSY